MDEEIFEIYKRNLPFITRKKEIVTADIKQYAQYYFRKKRKVW